MSLNPRLNRSDITEYRMGFRVELKKKQTPEKQKISNINSYWSVNGSMVHILYVTVSSLLFKGIILQKEILFFSRYVNPIFLKVY